MRETRLEAGEHLLDRVIIQTRAGVHRLVAGLMKKAQLKDIQLKYKCFRILFASWIRQRMGEKLYQV